MKKDGITMTVSACKGGKSAVWPIRVAVVTGAGRGIGLETARQLSGLGLRVILTSPDPAQGAAAAAKLAREGFYTVFHVLDVADDKSVLALKEFVLARFSRVDVLVNNGGVMYESGRSRVEGLMARRLKKVPRRADFGEGPSLLKVDLDLVRAALEINTLGALRMCQAFMPEMIKAGYGRVVNVSSTLGQLSSMDDANRVPAYQLSKTALNAVTVMAADDAAGSGVLMNSVCPGWTRTDIGGGDAPQSAEQAAKTIVWLARLPDGGPTGGFFRNKRSIAW